MTRKSVLIAGSPPNAELIVAALEKRGYEVLFAENPYDAAVRFDDARPTGVFVHLDDLDDEELELVATLRRIDPVCRIIVGFTPLHRDRAVTALRMGADAYVLEPFYLSELVALLERAEVEPAPEPTTGPTTEPAPGSTAPEEDAPEQTDATPEALESFAGGVAHEINNPLTVICGWVEILLGETPEGDPRGTRLRSILEETRRIQRVVDNLQAFARQPSLELEPIDLNEEIRAVIGEGKAEGWLEKVDPSLTLLAGLPQVRGDRESIQTLFSQLFRNAVQAVEGKGSLAIETRVDDEGNAIVFLADDGPGVAEEHRERLFLPFFSGFTGASTTGLGLAACRGIMLAHGGAIRLVTDRDEPGAAFELRFPAIGGLSEAPSRE